MIIDKPLETAPALQISVGDILAAHAELSGRGVEVSPVQHFVDGAPVDGPGGDYNSFIFFTDPDGNSWAIQQSPRLR
jgi:catechol 2,3-dioxygenase-like lactoylglutathione lyase family enzyme